MSIQKLLFFDVFEFHGVWDWRSFLVYFLVAVIVTGLVKLQKIFKSNRSLQYLFTTLAVAALTVFSALRAPSVGYDLGYYISHFTAADQLQLNLQRFLLLKDNEPLYSVYEYLLRLLTDDAKVFLLANAFILALANVLLISELWENRNTLMLVPLFIIGYVYKFSAVRTGMAEAFVLFSLYFYLKGSKGKAFVMAFLAPLFHYTGAVGLLFLAVDQLLEYLSYHASRRNFLLLNLALVMLAAAVAQAFRMILIQTKYAYYLQYGGTLIGNVFIIALFLMALMQYAMTANNRPIQVVKHGALFSGMLVPFVVIIGAYRLTDYFILLRVAAWAMLLDELASWISQRVRDGRKGWHYHTWINAGIQFVVMLVYLLFKLSRVANSAKLMPFLFE